MRENKKEKTKIFLLSRECRTNCKNEDGRCILNVQKGNKIIFMMEQNCLKSVRIYSCSGVFTRIK